MEYLHVVFMAMAVFKTAESLHCWKCQSQAGGPCEDYFNETRIRNSHRSFSSIDNQIPSEENCDSILGFQITDQKGVCMKKVETVNGIKHYTRKCEFIHVDLTAGECPKPQISNPHVRDEYCQYCDTNYCNDSDLPRTVGYWLILAPLISILFLRL